MSHDAIDAPVTLRPAEPRDAPALGRLDDGFDRRRCLAPTEHIEEGYGRFLTSHLGDQDVLVLVAERAGEVVGYAYAAVEPWSWQELREVAGFVHDVIVADEERN